MVEHHPLLLLAKSVDLLCLRPLQVHPTSSTWRLNPMVQSQTKVSKHVTEVSSFYKKFWTAWNVEEPGQTLPQGVAAISMKRERFRLILRIWGAFCFFSSNTPHVEVCTGAIKMDWMGLTDNWSMWGALNDRVLNTELNRNFLEYLTDRCHFLWLSVDIPGLHITKYFS